MESYKLVDGLKFKHDRWGRELYYGVWPYRASVQFRGAGYTRSFKSEAKFLDWLETRAPYSSNTLQQVIENASGDTSNLKKLIRWRTSLGKETKLVYTLHKIQFYFVDPAPLKDFLAEFPKCEVSDLTYRTSMPGFQRRVVYHKNPVNSIRVYFNRKQFTVAEWDSFMDICKQAEAKTCSAINGAAHGGASRYYWITSSYRNHYIFSGNWIDINSESWITVLGLKWPELIMKVCPIEKG